MSCAHGPHLLSAKLNDNGSDNYFNIGSNDFDSSSEWKKSQDDSHERPNKLTQAEHHVNNNNAMSILPAQIITPPMVPVSSKKKSGYFSSNDYSSDFESEDDFALKSSSAQSTRGSEGERAIADEALQVGLGGYSTDFESSGDFDIDNTANDPSKENNSYETDEYSFDFDENEQDFEDAPEQSGTLQATPSFSGPQASSSVPTVKKVQTSEISVQTEHVEVLSKVSEKITLNTPCQTEPDFPYPLSKFVDEYRTHVAKIRETYLQPSLPQRVLHVGGVKNPTSMTRGAPEETWRGGPRAESGCGVLTALLPELKSQPGDDAHLSHTLSTGIDIGTGILNLHSQTLEKVIYPSEHLIPHPEWNAPAIAMIPVPQRRKHSLKSSSSIHTTLNTPKRHPNQQHVYKENVPHQNEQNDSMKKRIPSNPPSMVTHSTLDSTKPGNSGITTKGFGKSCKTPLPPRPRPSPYSPQTVLFKGQKHAKHSSDNSNKALELIKQLEQELASLSGTQPVRSVESQQRRKTDGPNANHRMPRSQSFHHYTGYSPHYNYNQKIPFRPSPLTSNVAHSFNYPQDKLGRTQSEPPFINNNNHHEDAPPMVPKMAWTSPSSTSKLLVAEQIQKHSGDVKQSQSTGSGYKSDSSVKSFLFALPPSFQGTLPDTIKNTSTVSGYAQARSIKQSKKLSVQSNDLRQQKTGYPYNLL